MTPVSSPSVYVDAFNAMRWGKSPFTPTPVEHFNGLLASDVPSSDKLVQLAANLRELHPVHLLGVMSSKKALSKLNKGLKKLCADVAGESSTTSHIQTALETAQTVCNFMHFVLEEESLSPLEQRVFFLLSNVLTPSTTATFQLSDVWKLCHDLVWREYAHDAAMSQAMVKPVSVFADCDRADTAVKVLAALGIDTITSGCTVKFKKDELWKLLKAENDTYYTLFRLRDLKRENEALVDENIALKKRLRLGA